MIEIIANVLGILGAIISVGGHVALGRGYLSQDSVYYPLLFFISKTLLLVSLCIIFNLGAFIATLVPWCVFLVIIIDKRVNK